MPEFAEGGIKMNDRYDWRTRERNEYKQRIRALRRELKPLIRIIIVAAAATLLFCTLSVLFCDEKHPFAAVFEILLFIGTAIIRKWGLLLRWLPRRLFRLWRSGRILQRPLRWLIFCRIYAHKIRARAQISKICALTHIAMICDRQAAERKGNTAHFRLWSNFLKSSRFCLTNRKNMI